MSKRIDFDWIVKSGDPLFKVGHRLDDPNGLHFYLKSKFDREDNTIGWTDAHAIIVNVDKDDDDYQVDIYLVDRKVNSSPVFVSITEVDERYG
jgi:hypothetical protein